MKITKNTYEAHRNEKLSMWYGLDKTTKDALPDALMLLGSMVGATILVMLAVIFCF